MEEQVDVLADPFLCNNHTAHKDVVRESILFVGRSSERRYYTMRVNKQGIIHQGGCDVPLGFFYCKEGFYCFKRLTAGHSNEELVLKYKVRL